MSPDPDPAPVFEAQHLRKVYRTGEVEVVALRDVSLAIARGEFIVLLGPSGSGKSTLLNILGGLDVPTSGEVRFADHLLTGADEAALTRYRREHVGFVFQFYNLIPSLTVRENVALVTDIAAHPMDIDESLGLVGLLPRRDHFPAQLSGGEQQRVAIARAIVKRPDVLLCDEPTGALDYPTGRLVLEVIERVNRELGTTVVVITHNAAIAGMADRVIRHRSRGANLRQASLAARDNRGVPKIYYGWRMAAAGAGLQFLVSALLVQAFGAYVAVLSAEFGWSRTALAGGAAIQSLEGALIGPVLGWLVDRLGPRAVVRAGVVIFALGFLVFSTVETIPGFYVAVTLIAVGASMSGYFPLSVCLMHFFERRRARALSLMSLGLAAGGLALPVLSWSIAAFGWRTTCVGAAGFILVAGWPLASILRRHPSEVGQEVDGEPRPTPAASTAPSEHGTLAPSAPPPAPTWKEGLTAAQALRTQAFWLLAVGHSLALLVVTAVNVHAISHMKQELGYSLPQASFIITLMTIAQGAGMLLGAAVGDRWSKRHIAALCMLAHMVGLLMLAYAVHVSMLIVFAVLHGMAWGLRGPLMQALRADFFGVREIGMIMGLSAVVISIGQVVGPLVAGAVYDWTGHYQVGFLVLALLAGGGSVMFLRARPPA